MISETLKTLCKQLLSTDDIRAIAQKYGFSYGYINDIKNRVRYNQDIENELKKAVEVKRAEINKANI